MDFVHIRGTDALLNKNSVRVDAVGIYYRARCAVA